MEGANISAITRRRGGGPDGERGGCVVLGDRGSIASLVSCAIESGDAIDGRPGELSFGSWRECSAGCG